MVNSEVEREKKKKSKFFYTQQSQFFLFCFLSFSQHHQSLNEGV